MAICSGQKQWERTKRKGRCQRHACGEAQGENCEYHGSAPFLVVWKLPEQGKYFRDRHHVLEFLVLVKKKGRHSAARVKEGKHTAHDDDAAKSKQ